MRNALPQAVSRRQILGAAASGALAALEAGRAEAKEGRHTSMIGVPFAAHSVVRVGLIGCGGRGMSLLNDLLGIEAVSVRAVCDIVAEKVAAATEAVTRAGHPPPAGYARGDHHFEQLVLRDDLDLVYVATPWNWHVPMAVASMRAGKHVAVEVPAANTVAECWALVDTSEKSRRHCVILENCCYGATERMVLRMIQAGLLGELHHAEAAYIHDLRGILFARDGEALWRRAEHLKRNGNLYPTHGLGPVALYFGINRGDRFTKLVSMSSPELGLTAYQKATTEPRDPRRSERYACGDMNTSLLKTALGRTVVLQHDVVSPRPYDRNNLVSGTKGCFRDYPPRLFLDGQEGHDWQSIDAYRKEWEDPLWRRLGEAARSSGHGGMDYIMSWRLVECMRLGLPPELDVYDAAAWSAPAELSEKSVASGSEPVGFPDFTRGLWNERRTGQEAGV
jgi:hypothetical protein